MALRIMGLRDVPSASDPARHDATSDCQSGTTSVERNATSSDEQIRTANFVLAAIDALRHADGARVRARLEKADISAATSTIFLIQDTSEFCSNGPLAKKRNLHSCSPVRAHER